MNSDRWAFQTVAIEAVRAAMQAGNKNVILMAPTGAGKTNMSLSLVEACLAKGKRAIFVCDRTTLVDQTAERAEGMGLPFGIIQGGRARDSSQPFQIATAQALAGRGWPPADLVVIDEAHTQYSAVLDHVNSSGAKVVGLTATPFAKGLGQTYQDLVNAATADMLTSEGYLTPLRCFSCTRISMAGAAVGSEEWTDTQVEERGVEIVGDVVRDYLAYGQNRKSIVFASTVKHCQELCEMFTAQGVMAACFTFRTKDEERKQLLAEYRKPDSALRVLISVEALAKGFDVPDVSCVIDCRPLRKSLSTFIQMIGRGLRAAPGKVDCILLDHSGNINRFKEDYEDYYFNGVESLDAGEKLDSWTRAEPDEKEDLACPNCQFKPFVMQCMSCGHRLKLKSDVTNVPGEMQELELHVHPLARDEPALLNQLCSHVRKFPGDRLKQLGKVRWYFKEIARKTLPPDFSLDDAPDVDVSKDVKGKITSINMAWAHGRGRKAKK